MIKIFNSLIYHDGFMKYFKNTSWLFVEKILNIMAGVIIGVWVAKYLGPEQYGLFNYVLSFVGLFASIGTLGLDGIVVRELVKNESNRDKLLGTAFYLKLIGAFLMLLILSIVVTFTSNDKYTNTLVFIIASATIFHSFNVINFYFQSRVLSRYVAFANIINLMVSSIIKVVLILVEAPMICFVYLALFNSFVLAMSLLYYYFKNNLSIKRWKFDKPVAFSLLKDSWPLVFAGLALSTQSYIDQIMLKEMIGLKEVAYYSIAFRFMALFGFLPMIIQRSLLPAIVNSKTKSPSFYEFRMLNYYRLMMIMFLCISLPIYIYGEEVVLLLYGEPYREAGFLFSIFGFRLLFAFYGVGRSSYLLNENMQQQRLYTLLLASIVNIVLNYIFIPIYGVLGAVFTSFISFTLNIFIFDLFVKATRNNVYLMVKAMVTFWKINIREEVKL
jgi:O-antigen/teichoic acid export membrane protein